MGMKTLSHPLFIAAALLVAPLLILAYYYLVWLAVG